MKYLIVIDSTGNGRPARSYLCHPNGRGASWFWTFQREEAAEFASWGQARRIIETRMKLKGSIRIVLANEDPLHVAGS